MSARDDAVLSLYLKKLLRQPGDGRAATQHMAATSSVQFSSVQFKMVSTRSIKPIIKRSTPSLRKSPNVAFETVPHVRLIDDSPLSSFQTSGPRFGVLPALSRLWCLAPSRRWCLAPSRLWCLAPALSVATPDHGQVGVFQLVSLRMFCVYQVA